MQNEQQIPDEELDQPLPANNKTPLELLPELTMLEAKITDIKYQYKMYNGAQVYKVDAKQQPILIDGQKIPKKEFKITFDLKDYKLSNGNPRNAWLNVDSGIWEDKKTGKIGKLLALFRYLNIELNKDMPVKQIQSILLGRSVRFQMINKPSGKQAISFDTIRPVDEATTKVVSPEDIAWEE